MTPGEMPEIEMDVDDSGLDLSDVDITPMLLRRFAWDTLPCSEVASVLPALGLTHGTEEGMHLDHRDSHQRIAQVFPLEPYLQRFAEVMGVVLSTAMAHAANDGQGIDLADEESVRFAEQTAEVALCSSRAIIAQFIETGVLEYGSRVAFVVTEAPGE